MSKGRSSKVESKAKSIYRATESEEFSWEKTMNSLYKYNSQIIEQSEGEILIPVDLSSLEKKEANRMEALDRVGKEVKKGYWIIGAMGIIGDKRLLLECSLYSTKEEDFLSQNTEIEKALQRIKEQTKQKEVIFLMDMGFDNIKVMRQIEEQKNKYIIRAYHDRKVEIRGKERKLKSYLQTKKTDTYIELWVKIEDKKKKVRFTLRYIPEAYIKTQDNTYKIAAVYLQSTEKNLKEMLLITNLRINNEIEAAEVVKRYLKRWTIEDFFKFIKESLGMEAIRVLKLKRIRAVLSWTVVAAAYIYEVHAHINGDKEIIRVLATLGGWIGRGKIGKKVLKRGLEKFLTVITTLAILKDMGADIEEMKKKILHRSR